MAHFDRDDILAAWNLYLAHNPTPANQKRHTRLNMLGWLPSLAERELSGLSENALAIYRNLVKPPTPEYPVANSHTSYSNHTLFRMWAGAYRHTIVYVWADSFESAFEEFVEWLDDNAPGHLTTNEEFLQFLNESAQELHGKTWNELEREWKEKNAEWAGWHNDMCNEYSDVIEHAEADLTSIGHTTLKNGAYITSYEWGGEEVTDSDEYEVVLLAGVESCD